MTATTDGSTGAANLRAAPASDPTEPTTAPDDILGRRAAGRGTLGGAPPRQAGRAGLVEGRPRHQRHHGRRGPAAPSVPRHPGPGHRQAAARFIRGEQLRRRHLEHLLRGAAATSPPPSRRTSRCGSPATGPDDPHMSRGRGLGAGAGRHRGVPGLHPDLARALRLVEVGRPARTPTRADVLPEVGPAQHLRLRLLGPPDHRAAHHRVREAARTARPVRPGRTAHRPGAPQPAQARCSRGQLGRRLPAARQGAAPLPQGRPAQAAAPAHERRRPLDHRTPGERRLLGRHPAPRRVLRHRPAPARLRPGPPGDAGGPRLARPVHRLARGRRPG